MKTKSLLFALFVCCSVGLLGQTITQGKIWYTEHGMACFIEDSNKWGCWCYLGIGTTKVGDTATFNGKVYYELLWLHDDSYQQQWNIINYVREDGKKIFFYDTGCNKEYLMYDFELNLGDTIFLADPRFPFSIFNQNNRCEFTEYDSLEYQYVVIDVDSIEYNQVKRKMLKLEIYFNPYSPDIWVEGIGCMRGINQRAASHSSGVRQLKGCYESDTLIFVNENPEYYLCYYDTCIIIDTNAYTAVICQSETYNDANFTNLTQEGVYYDTLQNVNGCDSVICLTLSYYSIDSIINYSASICQGAFYTDNHFTNLTVAGTYYDTLQNINGCDSVIELVLTVNPIYFTQIIDSISAGGTYDFNGKMLTEAGTYYDTLQTIHDCDSIFELTLTVTGVGIPQWTMENGQLKIYPNPTSGQLHITMGHAPLLEDSTIEIYNVVGQKLLSIESLESTETTIDVQHLAKGMYFLKIGNQVVRFVKE